MYGADNKYMLLLTFFPQLILSFDILEENGLSLHMYILSIGNAFQSGFFKAHFAHFVGYRIFAVNYCTK